LLCVLLQWKKNQGRFRHVGSDHSLVSSCWHLAFKLCFKFREQKNEQGVMPDEYSVSLACGMLCVASVVPRPGLSEQIRCKGEFATRKIHIFAAVYDAWRRPSRCWIEVLVNIMNLMMHCAHIIHDHSQLHSEFAAHLPCFWDVTPCNALQVHRGLGVTFYFHLQGRRMSQASNELKACKQNKSLAYLFLWEPRELSRHSDWLRAGWPRCRSLSPGRV
jgi:hypothetical protein